MLNAAAVAHQSKTTLCRQQHQMIALARSVLEHGGNVIGFKIGVVRDDFFATGTCGKQIQHVTHSDTHAPNTRATTAMLVVERDTVYEVLALRNHRLITKKLSRTI